MQQANFQQLGQMEDNQELIAQWEVLHTYIHESAYYSTGVRKKLQCVHAHESVVSVCNWPMSKPVNSFPPFISVCSTS